MITIESPAQRAYLLLDQGRAADPLALATPFIAGANAAAPFESDETRLSLAFEVVPA